MVEDRRRILCLARSGKHLAALQYALSNGKEFSVLTAATADQAVALCVAHIVDAAVVDAQSIRGQEWSVVKSLKMVRPGLPILLLDERKDRPRFPLPEGISEVVAVTSAHELREAIRKLLNTRRD